MSRTMMRLKVSNWWKWLIAALSSLALLWRERVSRDSKVKREAYERAEKKIADNDPDVQSDIDDLLNGL